MTAGRPKFVVADRQGTTFSVVINGLQGYP